MQCPPYLHTGQPERLLPVRCRRLQRWRTLLKEGRLRGSSTLMSRSSWGGIMPDTGEADPVLGTCAAMSSCVLFRISKRSTLATQWTLLISTFNFSLTLVVAPAHTTLQISASVSSCTRRQCCPAASRALRCRCALCRRTSGVCGPVRWSAGQPRRMLTRSCRPCRRCWPCLW